MNRPSVSSGTVSVIAAPGGSSHRATIAADNIVARPPGPPPPYHDASMIAGTNSRYGFDTPSSGYKSHRVSAAAITAVAANRYAWRRDTKEPEFKLSEADAREQRIVVGAELIRQ